VILTIIWWVQKLDRDSRSAKFDMGIFSAMKLNDMTVKEENHVKTSNRFAALENLVDDDDVDISRARDHVRKNMKAFSYRESRLL